MRKTWSVTKMEDFSGFFVADPVKHVRIEIFIPFFTQLNCFSYATGLFQFFYLPKSYEFFHFRTALKICATSLLIATYIHISWPITLSLTQKRFLSNFLIVVVRCSSVQRRNLSLTIEAEITSIVQQAQCFICASHQ